MINETIPNRTRGGSIFSSWLKKPSKEICHASNLCMPCQDEELIPNTSSRLDQDAFCLYTKHLLKKKKSIESLDIGRQWTELPNNKKFKYYWKAIDNMAKLFTEPKANFLHYYKMKFPRQPRAQCKALQIWNRMNYIQRLPFIVESLVAKYIESSDGLTECSIKAHFKNRKP